MWYNRSVQDAQLVDQSFQPLDDENIFRRDLIPIKSMSKFDSRSNSLEDFNLDYLNASEACRWKLSLHCCCVRWSTSGHGVILLKCPIGCQDVVSVLESHWKHFSNVPGKIDRSIVPSSKMPIGDTLFQQTNNPTITFSGNIRYCFAPVLLSASTRLIAYIRSFWHS